MAFVCLTVVGWTTAGILNGQGLAFYLISIGGTSVLFAWQISVIDFDSAEDCGKNFAVRSPSCGLGSSRLLKVSQLNGYAGAIFFTGLLLDYYLIKSS